MTPRSTPLLGFKPPFVKDGEIVLPVLTGTGDWAELHATPATWQRISIALALHWTPPAKQPKPTAPRCAPVTKPNGNVL